ncbi:hypothetical protein C5Y96_22530 [Blastopirellula marina]|uniref:Uncharacterized protein n=1 Tax=Blastopirellula marina TaxID=124 RepID=A0A2S8F104_9BACT|nr:MULTISPECIES: hypothetical protein [Pirellulaceae]PQO25604.1 hypothetical protein C5Y96_22530 [Blastopirellula marina]RCS43287.1 hypothetical protein DTL36_22580 [Bremerella cremea]
MLGHGITNISGSGAVANDLEKIYQAYHLKYQPINFSDIKYEYWRDNWQRIIVLDNREASPRMIDVLPELKVISRGVPVVVVASQAEQSFELLTTSRLDGAEGVWFSETGTESQLMQLLGVADRKLIRWSSHLAWARHEEVRSLSTTPSHAFAH